MQVVASAQIFQNLIITKNLSTYQSTHLNKVSFGQANQHTEHLHLWEQDCHKFEFVFGHLYHTEANIQTRFPKWTIRHPLKKKE